MKVNRFMDAPSQWMGSWHGSVRHNPPTVARELSRTLGMPYQDALNAARLHKIADIVHNTRPVDGIQITGGMRQEADRILAYVQKNGRLPSDLPHWVDQPGTGKPAAETSGKALAAGTAPEWTAIRKVKAGAGLAAVYFLVSTGVDVAQAALGHANPNDLPEQIAHNAGKAVAAGGLYTAVLVVGFSNPGTAVLIVAGAGSVIVAEMAYSAVKPLFEREMRAYAAYYERMPDSMKGASPMESVPETPTRGSHAHEAYFNRLPASMKGATPLERADSTRQTVNNPHAAYAARLPRSLRGATPVERLGGG